ncbi:MAG TPA: Crp/Fnr family transcriptional regulator [Bryobacteraceae bacterium]|nr:Crp/Fnr family transcriptional regulator [Bryobacteraceae bacterium]
MPIDKVAALRTTALFGELGEAELKALAARAVEQKLDRNETLFIAGDAARGLYVIVQGAVRAYRVGPDGREQVIHVEQAGAVIGDLPVFDEGTYPSNVAGEEETTLLFIDRTSVQRLCLSHPQISLAALKTLARRLRTCAALVETLSLHDVDRRLARLLLDQARQHGTRKGARVELELTLTHQQIATRIGSVREVVSRAFSRLQQAGYVALEGRRVIITNEPAFRAWSEG